jgi:DNA-binding LytR/AlgR family response regulator
MKEINCLIVDDEPLARKILETYLVAFPDWRVIQSCINALEAYDALQQHSIDVMFLDIRMPVISGIDFLRSLPNRPLVVFTTAFSDHAVTGFELDAVDYLVKPITADRFRQAIGKVQQRLLSAEKGPPIPQPAADYIFIRQDARLVRVNFADILYVEAKRDFTSIHCKEKKFLAGMHLKALESLLAVHPRILRVHRSYIVNLDAIQSIQGNILEIQKTEIPIGANYKDELYKKLGI